MERGSVHGENFLSGEMPMLPRELEGGSDENRSNKDLLTKIRILDLQISYMKGQKDSHPGDFFGPNGQIITNQQEVERLAGILDSRKK